MIGCVGGGDRRCIIDWSWTGLELLCTEKTFRSRRDRPQRSCDCIKELLEKQGRTWSWVQRWIVVLVVDVHVDDG